MGRAIDRWVLRAALGCGAYLLFLNAWGSIPLAGALTLACGGLLCAALKKGPLPRRRSASEARAALQRLAAMTEPEAEAELAPLVRGRWPGEDFALRALLKHPSAGAGANDVLALWKSNRGTARLVIAATCPLDARAAAYARSLSEPLVAVLDAGALLRLLRDAPSDAPAPPLGQRIRRGIEGFSARLARPAEPRFIFFALALLALYLRTGRLMCLLGALWVAFRLGAGMALGRPKRRLFG